MNDKEWLESLKNLKANNVIGKIKGSDIIVKRDNKIYRFDKSMKHLPKDFEVFRTDLMNVFNGRHRGSMSNTNGEATKSDIKKMSKALLGEDAFTSKFNRSHNKTNDIREKAIKDFENGNIDTMRLLITLHNAGFGPTRSEEILHKAQKGKAEMDAKKIEKDNFEREKKRFRNRMNSMGKKPKETGMDVLRRKLDSKLQIENYFDY